ncbi:aldo/keto reductase, partial [Methylobacterium radiotolerans]|uniref:aldo/keto reductase n=1 Tax=Methylobacterium radiotolerans TaxID=31998 RepID=UPI00117C4A1F
PPGPRAPGPPRGEGAGAASEGLGGQGKGLSWGVSNFDVPDLEAAWEAGGEGRIACNQVLYHLEERAIEHAVQPWCEAHGIAVVAYSPFGHGSFPGPRTPGGRPLASIAAHPGAPARQVARRLHLRRPSGRTAWRARGLRAEATSAGGRARG